MSLAQADEVLARNGDDGVTVVAVQVEVTLLRCGLAVHTVGIGQGEWHGHRSSRHEPECRCRRTPDLARRRSIRPVIATAAGVGWVR